MRDLLAEPEKPTSWAKGADGEEALGASLERLRSEGFVVLHDRQKPGTRWNVDHIVIGPRGVYVIDAKHYKGLLEVRPTGSFFRRGPGRLFVGGRAKDSLVTGMDWQVAWIDECAGELLAELGGVIRSVLCFIGVRLEIGQSPELAGESEVLITWPRRFVKDISREGPLTADGIAAVAARIATALPPARTK